jgi:hypothetical protein
MGMIEFLGEIEINCHVAEDFMSRRRRRKTEESERCTEEL